jgi:glutamate N-acetyltransferase/amino-acid N-acetyltransferase
MTPGPGLARTFLPKGFWSSGVNSGVRRYRPDLGVLVSDTPAVAAGVFTLNECKAAPILYSSKLVPSSGIRAIVTNSGQANAATGELGLKNNLAMASEVARVLKCETSQILTASTGVIGPHLDIEKITRAIPELMDRVQATAEPFALSILTTDLVPKTVSAEIELEGGTVRLTGICKGSGMIHPNMGTMLGYFLTDVVLTEELAHRFLKDAVDQSFNMVSVDGDSSTNDCAFLMANGASGVSLKSQSDVIKFQETLNEVSIFLAKSIARDGEGATKLIEVNLRGAPTLDIARKAARGLVVSPLVKTAVHGQDPNWGRVLARLGQESVPSECFERMVLKIQDTLLFKEGAPVATDLGVLRTLLKSDTVTIDIDLQSGTASTLSWGCDLSSKYVQINADYTT